MTEASDTSELRGRILDILELISDTAAQLLYQQRAQDVDIAAELFNQWDDAYHPDDAVFQGQFGADELQALADFESALSEVAAATPQQLPPLHEFVETPEHAQLSAAAATALSRLDRAWVDGRMPPPRDDA